MLNVKKYTKEELKEMAIKKIIAAKNPDEYLTVYNNIKKSECFTDKELREIAIEANKIKILNNPVTPKV